ncbi:hypothetical protein HELRODRAFT_162524 [Helobdella robusta]|uniref:Uncharacterized protein n=1 Tax=Helobdella robusta TaxID=6412 RepID=T1ESS8_HELRO|nr:hypothetical protein HELRODRAFT_162524 [Helobdella robusta]ESN99046.1 hypothetical protein HELRODRAFT_162524 [Helobdella robusta]
MAYFTPTTSNPNAEETREFLARKCNDNPNVQQLETIFKRVYFRCGIVPGKTGNVQEQLIEDSEFKIPEEQFQHIFEETNLELEFLNQNTMSTIIDNAVAYIVDGWFEKNNALTIINNSANNRRLPINHS